MEKYEKDSLWIITKFAFIFIAYLDSYVGFVQHKLRFWQKFEEEPNILVWSSKAFANWFSRKLFLKFKSASKNIRFYNKHSVLIKQGEVNESKMKAFEFSYNVELVISKVTSVSNSVHRHTIGFERWLLRNVSALKASFLLL